MKLFRRILLWAVLAMVAILVCLSVVGAFLGAERASTMFNSRPLAAFWILMVAALVAGLLSFKRLIRRPGLLAMHLGSLLVLLGAMYGSAKGHALAARLLGIRKIPNGYMVIYEGRSSSSLIGAGDTEIGRLPFKVHLKDFWLETYPLDDDTWPLVIVTPASDPHDHDSDGGPQEALIEWSLGEATTIPNTDAQLTVLTYIPSARPAYPPDALRTLEITGTDGVTMTLPPRAGEELSLKDPECTVRVVQVFAHLMVQGSGETREVIDMPGRSDNPALKVEIVLPDGTKHSHYVYGMVQMAIHGSGIEGLDLRYGGWESVGAEPDPGTGLPAMELLIVRDGQELRQWLLIGEGDGYDVISLAPLFDEPGAEGRDHGDAQVPSLYLFKPTRMPKDFKSDLVVLEEDQEVLHKVIEVNDPLNYGGYQFIQSGYDEERHEYTVLGVTSNSGLGLVYVGFVLVGAGIFWWFWVRPALSYLSGRGADGD